MCRKHEPVALFVKSDAATQPQLALAYVLHVPHWKVRCAKCGLIGNITQRGRIRWLTPGTVGWLSREETLKKADEWNAKVATAK